MQHWLTTSQSVGQKYFNSFECQWTESYKNKIQPEGVTWSIGLSTVLKYDGETLRLQKGSISISTTHSEWNNLICYIPEILETWTPAKTPSFV